MTPRFDIDALRAVVAGIDLGSFARAAIELNRSHSAVSMQLKKLEQQVGTPLFVRRGRGLVPTEAGEILVAYARRMVALNDEAARALGACTTAATVSIGLPQDFFDDVMPATLTRFRQRQQDVHVDVRAGRNHALAEEVRSGRLDVAIAFCKAGGAEGEHLFDLPMHWLGDARFTMADTQPVPLVLFNHPCLFRQAALAALERQGRRWRAALTTPSLPGIWAALGSGLGVAVRTAHGKPATVADVGHPLGLPPLPAIGVHLLIRPDASPLARALGEDLRRETRRLMAPV